MSLGFFDSFLFDKVKSRMRWHRILKMKTARFLIELQVRACVFERKLSLCISVMIIIGNVLVLLLHLQKKY